MFSKTPKEHIERLREVFTKLVAAGFKLKPKKCEFFKSKIAYLGHIVSSKGIETDPKKVEAVKNWTAPRSHGCLEFSLVHQLLQEVHKRLHQSCMTTECPNIRGKCLQKENVNQMDRGMSVSI